MTRARAALALAAGALAACAASPRLVDVAPQAPAVELAAVPFFPQRDYQCGPAALATVLAASGVAVTADELTPQVFIPGREGSLQIELLAAARRHGRVPYLLPPEMDALLGEVAGGRPVLLLQNLGLDWIPVWHYAVLVGVDPGSDEVILRSGTDERRRMRFRHFLDSWRRGGQWAFVVTAPDDIPAAATPQAWLAAAAGFENLGQADEAEAAYRAATRRWPDSGLAWLALGNARYARRDLAGATRALRAGIAAEPLAAAHNNLAHVLLERGCARQAREQVELALRFGPASPALKRTAEAVRSYAGPARECAR